MIDFSTKQLAAIELLARPSGLTREQIAQQVGVDQATLYRWRQIPEFNQAVKTLAFELLQQDLPEVYIALKNKAVEGNVKAIEIMLKFADDMVDKQEVEVKGALNFDRLTDEDIDKEIAKYLDEQGS